MNFTIGHWNHDWKRTVWKCFQHNEERSVAPKRLIRTLRNKTYNHITVVSKYVYIDKLGIQLINTIICTVEQLKIKIGVKTCTDISFVNDKVPTFKVRDHVGISKCKNKVTLKIANKKFYYQKS